MRFWFVHSDEVSIREQIVTQITLGILSAELTPGERLPSTRDLARRFDLHPNTVSGAYRQLEEEGWVESRRGSGVYVRSRSVGSLTTSGFSSSQALDYIFTRFLNSAQRLNITTSDIRNLLQRWLESPKATHFLLIEPEEPLRRIILTEVQQALSVTISTCGPDDPLLMEKLLGAVPLTLPSKAAAVRRLLPIGTELITLQVRSTASSLAGWLPAPTDVLVGIASGWPQFLDTAHTMLIAAGFSPDTLLFRDTRQQGWLDGLTHTTGVVCDSFTSTQLPIEIHKIPFCLLTETTLERLRDRYLAMVSPDS